MSENTNASARWLLPLCVAIVLAVSLAVTAELIFDPQTQRLFATNEDIVQIARFAESAGPGEVASWWTGPWIQRTRPFYRPLASVWFWLQFKLFRDNYQRWDIVSWLMQAGVCLLMFFFVRRLFGVERPEGALAGLLAVLWFAIPHDKAGQYENHIGNRGIAWGVMPYFPVQTDIGSLALALGALLLLDRYLHQPSRRAAAGVLVGSCAALLWKETALVLPLLSALVVLYRRAWGRGAWLLAAQVGLVGLFLLARHAAVPNAWGPRWTSLADLLRNGALVVDQHGPRRVTASNIAWRALFYLHEPYYAYLKKGTLCLPAGVILATALPAVILRRRGPWWAAALVGLAVLALTGVVLSALYFGHYNPLVLTIGFFPSDLARMFVLNIGAIYVWLLRKRGPTLPLAGGVAVAHLPIIHVLGAHYFYWPVAWWAMLNGTLLALLAASAWGKLRALGASWKRKKDQ